MKQYILILLLLFYISGFAQDTLGLFNCYELAKDNYPISKQKKLYQQSNDLNNKSISTIYYPRLNLNGKATYQSDVTKIDLEFPEIPGIGQIPSPDIPEPAKDQYAVSLDFSQVLYDAGINKTLKDIGQADLNLNLQKTEVELYKLKDIINSLYFGILVFQETEKQLELTKGILEKQKSIIKSGITNGVLLESDEDLLSAELLKLEQKQMELKIKREKLINALAEYTGKEINDKTIIALPDNNVLPSTTIRPEDLYFDLTKSKLDASSKLLSKKRYPIIYGFGQVGYGRPGYNMLSDQFDSFYIVGAKLSWNLWDWNKTKNDKQNIEITKQIIDTQKETFDKNMNIAIRNSQSDIDNLEKMIETDEQIVGLRKNISKKSESQLKNGVIKFTDYLTDLNTETMAKIELAIHKIKLEQAKINYITLKGF